MLQRLMLAAFVLAGLVACGGGGAGSAGGGSLPHTTGPSSTNSASAPVRVVIPKAGSTTNRKPAYISPSTASFTISLYTVNGATPNPQPTPLTITIASNPDCTSNATSTACSINVPVPISNAVVLLLSTYDANGNLLGQAQIGPINTTLSTIPAVGVSVGGQPASLAFVASTFTSGDSGLTNVVPIGVIAKDADGNVIIAPGSYPTPITLSVSNDPNGALSFPTGATIASPSPTEGIGIGSMSYDSTKSVTQATITATSGSITATATFVPIIFSPTSLPSLSAGGSTQSVTVSEAGFSGAFTVTGTSSIATVTCVPSNCTPSTPGGSITVNVAPGSAGTESVTIGNSGGFANLPITVTGAGGGGALVGAPTIYSFSSAAGGENYGIAVGPDGNSLWFVDAKNSEVGAVANPSTCISTCSINESALTSITDGATTDNLLGITSASDGNLYVTDEGDGSEDQGNLLQLSSCNDANGSCSSGSMYTADSLGASNPIALAGVIQGADSSLYVASNSTESEDGILWSYLTGCCNGMGTLYIPGDDPAIATLAFDSTGTTLFFSDVGDETVGFVNSSLPCFYTCYAYEPLTGGSQTEYGPGSDAVHRNPHPVRATAHRAMTLTPHHPVQFRKGPPRRINMPAAGTFSMPYGIVAGPDGNIYVADEGGDIAQINAVTWENSCSQGECGSVNFAQIALTSTNPIPMNLTVGPDGNIWFTDASGYIGVIVLNSTCSSTGVCTVHEYPVGGEPYGIVKGPDGNLWFTDSSSNKIGKVVLQ